MPQISFTDYGQAQESINRRRKMAEMLQQQGMEPAGPQETAGGFVVPVSWTQGLAKALKAGVGGYQAGQLDRESKDLAQKTKSEAMDWAQSMPTDKPATPEQWMSEGIDERLQPGTDAVKATPQQLRAWALSGALSGNPLAQGMGSAYMAQLMKGPESLVSKIDPKDYTPDSVAKYMQTMNPAALVPIRKMETLTAAGQNGPETRFFNPWEPPTSPVAQPVKNEMVGLGNQVMPVNPYAQTSPLGIGVSPNTTYAQGQENARFAGVSGNTAATNAMTRRGQDIGANPEIQGALSQARGYGTDLGQAGAAMVVDPVKQATNATKILQRINYDSSGKTDDVSKLIDKSTSGMVQNVSANVVGGATGSATQGREAIGALQTLASQLTMEIMGGKLGSGISNADRDFVMQQLGDVGNANIPANERKAAWQSAVGRLEALSKNPTTLPQRRASDAYGSPPLGAVRSR